MEYISKGIYFLILILSLILVVSLSLLALDHWLHPFKKNSEATILFLSGVITIIGMFYSLKYGYNSSDISKGIFQLLGFWVVAAIFLTIGLVFFNGSSK